ncbi:MAG: hypothetical protein ACOZQL_15095 [Myxococcota bacterium]
MSAGLLLVTLLLAHPDLDEGRVAVSAMKYRAAVPALTRVTQDAAASDAEVVEAYSLLAKSQLALQKPQLAQAAYEGLLQRAPMTADPEGSPALRAAFQRAKTALFPPRTVRLIRKPSGADTLVVEVINPWRLALTASWSSARPDAPARVLTLEEGRVVTSLAPGSAGWLEVSAEGQVLAALGSRAEPLEGPPAPAVATTDAPKQEPTLAPQPKTSPEVLPPSPAPVVNTSRRVLGWTLVGLGVAATATGVGLYVGGVSDQTRGENWATLDIPYEEAVMLQARGPVLQQAGGITGGVGLAAAITGVVILLTE